MGVYRTVIVLSEPGVMRKSVCVPIVKSLKGRSSAISRSKPEPELFSNVRLRSLVPPASTKPKSKATGVMEN